MAASSSKEYLVLFVGLIFVLTIGALLFLFFKNKDGDKKDGKNEAVDQAVLNAAKKITEQADITNSQTLDGITQILSDAGLTEDELKSLTDPIQECIFYPSKRVFVENIDEDGNTARYYLDEESDTARSVSSDPDLKIEFTCPTGMELNPDSQCCKWEENKLSLLDKVEAIAPPIIEAIVVGYIFEKIVAKMRALYPSPGVFKAKMKVLKANLGRLRTSVRSFTRKATFEAGTKLGMRGGNIMGKAGSKGVWNTLTVGSKIVIKSGYRVARRSTIAGARGAQYVWKAKAAACPVCTAAVIAYEIVSAALDIADIHGYNTYKTNDAIKNLRNQAETALEASLYESDGITWPCLFPVLTAFPDLDEKSQCPDSDPNCHAPSPSPSPSPSETYSEHRDPIGDYEIPEVNEGYSSLLINAFMVDALMKMDPTQMVEMLVGGYVDEENPTAEPVISEETQTMFAEILIAEIDFQHIKRDKLLYDLCVSRGYGDQVEYIESMSSADVIGVTLNEYGARRYNVRMEEKHLRYSNPKVKLEEDEIPDDYAPLVAAYTDTYRVQDRDNPGTSQSPNVIEKKLDRKMTLMMPWASLMYNCLGTNKGDPLMSASYFAHNPSDDGVTFNYEKGYCNYTREYCRDRMKMDYKNKDCYLSRGQEIAEMIFGTTVTRAVKGSWDQRTDMFKSNDPGVVAGAVGLSIVDPTGFIQAATVDIVNFINASKGRGAGRIPIKCKDDEERKGQLCYPKCRDGYNSRALECEGVCPAGSSNSGFHCTQWTETKPCFLWDSTSKCRKKFKDINDNPIGVRSKAASTVAKPCMPGFQRRSYALGSAFCDKRRNRYSRMFMARTKSVCPDGYPDKQNGLCYKKCPDDYPRGRGPICMKERQEDV